MPLTHSRPSVRRPLAFARLRTAHDSTMRSLVSSSWDTPSDDESAPGLHHHHHHHHHHHLPPSPYVQPRPHAYSYHHNHNHSHNHSHSHSHSHDHTHSHSHSHSHHHHHHPYSLTDRDPPLSTSAVPPPPLNDSLSKSSSQSTQTLFTPSRTLSHAHTRTNAQPSTSNITPTFPPTTFNPRDGPTLASAPAQRTDFDPANRPSPTEFPQNNHPSSNPTPCPPASSSATRPPSSQSEFPHSTPSPQSRAPFAPPPPPTPSPLHFPTRAPHRPHVHVRSRSALRRPTLPPRAATDVSGAAMHAARMAELAARDAADASAAARAAASYARTLMSADTNKSSAVSTDVPAVPPGGWEPRHPSALSNIPGSNAGPPSGPARAGSVRGSATIGTALRGSGSIGAASKGRGVVRPVPLGKVWSFDLVALWHNAIRLEMRDLDDIVWGLVDTARTVTVQEIRAFFAWFSTFEAFVVTSLKAEEEVLFPWVEQWGRIEGDLSTANRITTKGTIIRGIRDTAACAALVGLDGDLPEGMVLTNPHRNYYDSLNVGLAEVKPFVKDRKQTGTTSIGSVSGSGGSSNGNGIYARVVNRVASHVASFSLTLLDYFQKQERSLPVIIDSLYDEEDMHSAAIERRMLRALWKCGRKDESMVIVMRAVEQAPFHRTWVHRNVKRVERFAMPVWKRRYNVGRGAITTKFRERNSVWELNSGSLEPSIMPYDDDTDLVGDRRLGDSPPRHSSSASLSLGHYSLSHSRSLDVQSQVRTNSRSPSTRIVPVDVRGE